MTNPLQSEREALASIVRLADDAIDSMHMTPEDRLQQTHIIRGVAARALASRTPSPAPEGAAEPVAWVQRDSLYGTSPNGYLRVCKPTDYEAFPVYAVSQQPGTRQAISHVERTLSGIMVGNDKNPSPHSEGYTKGFSDCFDAFKRALAAVPQAAELPSQEPDLLAELAKQPRWQLDNETQKFGLPGKWRVWKLIGSREHSSKIKVLGEGDTPAEALRAALASQKGQQK